MPLSWEFEDRPDHLFVRVDGEWQTQSTLEMIDEIGRRCRERGCVKVFCDMREVRGPLGEIDRYLAGSRVASRLKAVKFALLARADAVITGFGMAVAARRGGRLFVTKDAEEARQWLFAEDV